MTWLMTWLMTWPHRLPHRPAAAAASSPPPRPSTWRERERGRAPPAHQAGARHGARRHGARHGATRPATPPRPRASRRWQPAPWLPRSPPPPPPPLRTSWPLPPRLPPPPSPPPRQPPPRTYWPLPPPPVPPGSPSHRAPPRAPAKRLAQCSRRRAARATTAQGRSATSKNGPWPADPSPATSLVQRYSRQLPPQCQRRRPRGDAGSARRQKPWHRTHPEAPSADPTASTSARGRSSTRFCTSRQTERPSPLGAALRPPELAWRRVRMRE